MKAHNPMEADAKAHHLGYVPKDNEHITIINTDTREQDRYLPVANIARIMKTVLPGNAKVNYFRLSLVCILVALSCVLTADRQGCQGNHPGVCVRVHQLHHERGQRQVPAGEAEDGAAAYHNNLT